MIFYKQNFAFLEYAAYAELDYVKVNAVAQAFLRNT